MAETTLETRASGAEAAPPMAEGNLLEVRDLEMHFAERSGWLRRSRRVVRAVDGISFDVRAGETLGLVGESGCGKTTTGRCLVRTHAPTGGRLMYRGGDGREVDLAALPHRDLPDYRRQIRMIFQDPFSSLNPRMTVRDIIGEPLRVNGVARGAELDDRVADLLVRVGLRPQHRSRFPHAFSGGERQRIVIARALSLDPRLVIADEAVSALDVSVRAQILELMVTLQRERGLTYLFISHDLSVVEYLCDRVAVMYVGKVVELGPTEELFTRPQHPYTQALLAAVPQPDPTRRNILTQRPLEGEVADPADPPPGCHFHPRCPFARDICRTEEPALRPTADGRRVACHFAEELSLPGLAVDDDAAGLSDPEDT
ncbi:ABC transporter ATP-binding protein [Jiangella asiatica]|uniref:ATP-binding cassette domain-containing protein n=1 Tax=Jiangella asiatica TaxID=2530372 RepID=A0A4R5DA38_9ACTN|nr:oligopeptide/dipeptide ABC transporter ATP-binding protein [Jiangella asiatica]TDE08631.1 ATP-binding cassette domain-containing protein [Jiangella asiatica]